MSPLPALKKGSRELAPPAWKLPASLCLAAAASLLLAGCGSRDSTRFQGYIEGEFLFIAPQVAGTLEQLAVERGARVSAGDPLFVLDPEPERSAVAEAEGRLRQAKANLDDLNKGQRPSEINALAARLEQTRAALTLAELDLERIRKLNKDRVVAKDQLDQAIATFEQRRQQVAELTAGLETASLGARTDQIRAAEEQAAAQQSALDQAKWRLAQKRQSAPREALVFDTLYRPGEWVAAGRPVVSLLPPENVKVRFFVPEPVVGSIKPGRAVRVHVDGVDGGFPARVSFISPRAEFTPPVIYSRESRQKLVFLVEAVFQPADAANLHPGQPVDVTLEHN